MKAFDDFDTMRQADEWPTSPEEINPDEYDDWLQSVGITPEEFEADMKAMKAMDEIIDWYFSPWQAYEVDCDDGTSGDKIYEWSGYIVPSS